MGPTTTGAGKRRRIEEETMIRTCIALAALLAIGPLAASAADYPERPIKLVVPYAAGGSPDVLTRVMAEKMSDALGQKVVVDNRVGGGGMLAATSVAGDAPDGYTILLGASTHMVQKLLQPSLPFDPLKSFAPIGQVSTGPTVLVVDATSAYRTVADLVADAKKNPGKLNYGSGGIGSAAHLAGAAFTTVAGLDVVHVPYRGSVEIVPSILGGSTQYGFPIASTAIPLVSGGKVRALAVTSAARMPQLPGVPTLRESLGNNDDAVIDSWGGLWAPFGTPAPIVQKLFEATNKSLANPEVANTMEKVGAPVATSTSPAAFGKFMADEMAKLSRIVAASKISIQ